MKPIDLRSDTLTTPSIEMRRAMANAVVGDDCYGEDSTVQKLERVVADLFGKESALFMPTGTMSNQVALRIHTRPGDEVLTDAAYHIAYFESAQSSDLAGVMLNTCSSPRGVLDIETLERQIATKPRGGNYAQVRLIWLENSISGCGGVVFPLPRLREISSFARTSGYHLHIDGARIFNAAIAEGQPFHAYGECCDTISICFAKGLGAPFGAALLGSAEQIREAKRFRKWYGGALHQSGIMAAGALYALEHNISRLAEDHSNARRLALLLGHSPLLHVSTPDPETNMVYFNLRHDQITAAQFARECAREGVLLFPWTGDVVRAVTHLGITDNDIARAAAIISAVAHRVVKSAPHSSASITGATRIEGEESRCVTPIQ